MSSKYKKGKMTLIQAITPLNEKEEKIKFITSKKFYPQFEYPKLNYNPDKEIEKLNEKEFGGYLAEQRIKKNKELILLNEIKKSVNSSKFLELSLQLYGSPNQELVEEAKNNLKEIEFEKEKKYISHDTLIDRIHFKLKKYHLYNWKIYEAKNNTFSIVPSCNAIFVPKKKYGENEIKRLFLHEIDVHVLRTCNGLRQVYSRLFAGGIPKYIETEEGLALYLQELNGQLNKESLIKISASVVAINNMINNESFRKTYEMFRDLGFERDFAWDRNMRAYRGGGFTKDYIYFSGLKKVKQFHLEGNDLKQLYVGKISIDDLEWVRPLIEQGHLKKPMYLPFCRLSN
jgi:uncharacterized protein (TIGR02421 family)